MEVLKRSRLLSPPKDQEAIHPPKKPKPISVQQQQKPEPEEEELEEVEEEEEEEIILPGLPNDLSHLCLTLVPPPILFSVCRSWRRLLYSPSFPPFFSLYAFLSTPPETTTSSSSVEFFSFDPLSSTWAPLPPPPPRDPHLQLLHRHPSFLSRNLPVQSLTVSDHLVLVAGTTQELSPALSRPLVFHPETGRWFFGPSFTMARRWCAVGAVGGTVFLASGVGSRYCGEVARSMEKWPLTDEKGSKWERLTGLRDGRFSREAVEGVGFRGRMCMVNVKGNVVKEGVVYDPMTDTWQEMPDGMLAGWNGPAAAMDEAVMYVVDEGRGVLSEYDPGRDRWVDVVELPELKQAEQIAAGRGRVCVVVGGGARVLVVDVTMKPARVWTVEPPGGRQVVGVHVLPRVCRVRGNFV